jgi:hypothetical protein
MLCRKGIAMAMARSLTILIENGKLLSEFFIGSQVRRQLLMVALKNCEMGDFAHTYKVRLDIHSKHGMSLAGLDTSSNPAITWPPTPP